MPQLRYCPPCKLPPCERKLISVVKWNRSVSTGLPKWGSSAWFKKSRLIKEYLLYPSPFHLSRGTCVSLQTWPTVGTHPEHFRCPKEDLTVSLPSNHFLLALHQHEVYLRGFLGRKRAWKKSLQLAKGILFLTLTNVCGKLINSLYGYLPLVVLIMNSPLAPYLKL